MNWSPFAVFREIVTHLINLKETLHMDMNALVKALQDATSALSGAVVVLNNVKDQAGVLEQKIVDLTTALANAGTTTTPEVDAAVAGLQTQTQAVVDAANADVTATALAP